MSNSLAVMRMIAGLQQRNTPAILPLARTLPPSPPPSPRASRASRSSRSKHKKRRRSPSSSSSSSSSSDSDSSSSGYSSYESVDKIKKKMKEKPCEYVSPAGLDEKKTKKEAIKYLKQKECPRVEEFRRDTSAPSTPAPVPPPTAPVLSIEPVPEMKRKGRPPKPKEPKKREPTAYALAVGEARKMGKTFAEATAYAKEQIAKQKEEKKE